MASVLLPKAKQTDRLEEKKYKHLQPIVMGSDIVPEGGIASSTGGYEEAPGTL